jgi:hypothetical protein
MKALHVEQSLPICCSLAAIGGILEVGATAVTAVPAVREREGIEMKWWNQRLAIAGNVGLQAIGSLISHLVATWYGPVSLVVPFFYSATLLSNMLIFGLLGEHFTKNMRVGTHVIMVAVILLPVVGPDIQEDQDIGILMRHWYSIVWFVMLLVACAIAGVMLVLDISKYKMSTRVLILLIARASSISVNLTVSRAFILGPSQLVLIVFIIIKIISGAIYTYAIVVQSFNVEQARFVPLNATTIIIVNALTGIIIWEDWKVVNSWYGYVSVFVLLGLGCDLLLSVPMLNAENPEFGAKKQASIILRQKRGSMKSLNINTDHNYYDEVPDVDDGGDPGGNVHGGNARVSRKEAWKEIVSPIHRAERSPTGFEYDDDNVMHYTKNNDPWKQRTTPRSIGAALAEKSAKVAERPQKLGMHVVKAAKHISGKGKELVDIVHGNHLSRIAAWRETISPLKEKSRRHNTEDDSQTDE